MFDVVHFDSAHASLDTIKTQLKLSVDCCCFCPGEGDGPRVWGVNHSEGGAPLSCNINNHLASYVYFYTLHATHKFEYSTFGIIAIRTLVSDPTHL